MEQSLTQPNLPGTEAGLEDVSQLFSEWRRTRSCGRIPSHLWQAAVDLSEHYSLARICHALGLRYKSLKKRVEMHRSTGLREPNPPKFIELPLPDSLHKGESHPGCALYLKLSGSGFHLAVGFRINILSIFRIKRGRRQ